MRLLGLQNVFITNTVNSNNTVSKDMPKLSTLKADTVSFSGSELIYTKLEQQAYDTAKKLFKGKFRKNGKTPYFKHCKEVGENLKKAGYNQFTVAAGFLHDVVEDIPGWTIDKIKKEFGEKVGNLVEEVSHKDPHADWDTKLKNYIDHLKDISSEGKAIAACDKMASMKDDIRAYKKDGFKIFERLNASPRKQLIKHITIFDVIMSNRDPLQKPVLKDYKKTLREYGQFTLNCITNPN